ncbi:MAG TPA: DUF4136 domain-containing protein [Caulobacteraceae bacterium]|jgi:hypothetical protein
MPRRLFLTCVAGVVLIAASAYAGRPDISTMAAPGVSFAGYKTYAWVNKAPPGGMNPVEFQQIQADISAALAKKGYTQGDPGDLSLIISAGASQQTQYQEWGGWLNREVDTNVVTTGRLAVDAFDSKTRQAVWHGQAEETINPNNPNLRKIDSAVTRLMDKFPTGGGAVATPAHH